MYSGKDGIMLNTQKTFITFNNQQATRMIVENILCYESDEIFDGVQFTPILAIKVDYQYDSIVLKYDNMEDRNKDILKLDSYYEKYYNQLKEDSTVKEIQK